MKNLLLLYFLIIGSSLHAQYRNTVYVGMPVSTLAPVMRKLGVGFNVGALRQQTERYQMGFNFDVLVGSKSRPDDIPANLLTGESIETNFKTFTVHFTNRLDLTPASRTKLFVDGNIGFRYARFTSTQIGYLAKMKSEETIYKKSSGGLSAQVFLGLLIPLDEQNRFALALKTGVSSGSIIHYIDDRSISYDANAGKIVHGDEKKSFLICWQTSLDFVARISWPKRHNTESNSSVPTGATTPGQ